MNGFATIDGSRFQSYRTRFQHFQDQPSTTFWPKDLITPKVCSLGSKMLSDSHKTQRMDATSSFLTRYQGEGSEFLEKIVTGDETWVKSETGESKEQSRQRMQTDSPNKLKKFTKTFSEKKLMATALGPERSLARRLRETKHNQLLCVLQNAELRGAIKN